MTKVEFNEQWKLFALHFPNFWTDKDHQRVFFDEWFKTFHNHTLKNFSIALEELFRNHADKFTTPTASKPILWNICNRILASERQHEDVEKPVFPREAFKKFDSVVKEISQNRNLPSIGGDPYLRGVNSFAEIIGPAHHELNIEPALRYDRRRRQNMDRIDLEISDVLETKSGKKCCYYCEQYLSVNSQDQLECPPCKIKYL